MAMLNLEMVQRSPRISSATRTELEEVVRPCDGVHASAILVEELVCDVLEEGERGLTREVLLAEAECANGALDHVAENAQLTQ